MKHPRVARAGAGTRLRLRFRNDARIRAKGTRIAWKMKMNPAAERPKCDLSGRDVTDSLHGVKL